MTPERWQQVKAALHDALLLNGAARAAYLSRVGTTDPELHSELESLLHAQENAGSLFLAAPAAALFVPGGPRAANEVDASLSHAVGVLAAHRVPVPDEGAAAADPVAGRFVGRRLGPYRLIATIGSGGMGEVYRAVRADDEYRQQVAIKLVRGGQNLAFMAQRMRAERQILASFEHPSIARLLDGGTTDEGIPYLVMELIDGLPITRYCAERGLDVSERLELFLQVCSAVQYAHQRMVIHRDLKPSNILVTTSGTPKLLDFGIAKILDPAALELPSDATINAYRILTPQYASPEQLRGEAVTAASDVYSLGVLLYELLTGARPHALEERPTREGSWAAHEPEPRKPSTAVRLEAANDPHIADGRTRAAAARLAKRLRGDLDNIVLMALRREPTRRYATVDHLAQDIQRHLQHLPVSARRATLRYRATSFVVRHRLGVAASVLASIALATGFAMTAWEAHVARVQRARAERRFDDVRKLADTLIFDVHDSIADLPGAATSRRLVIDTALRYLDSLAAEAAGDPALQRDLAGAYTRLGDVQGRALEANDGDYQGALASYRRALALLDASVASDPSSLQARRDLIVICGKLSDLTWNLDDAAAALAYSRRTVEESERLAAGHPGEPMPPILLAQSELDYGFKLFKIRGDPAAVDYLGQAVTRLQALATANPANARLHRTLALAYGRRSEALWQRGREVEALDMARHEQAVLGRLSAPVPDNTDYRHLIAFSQLRTAAILTALGRLDEAERSGQAALGAFEALAAADPKIDEYRMDVGTALAGLARIDEARGAPAQALERLRRAIGQMGISSASQASAEFRILRADALAQLGRVSAVLAGDVARAPAQRAADAQRACEAYQEASTLYRRLAASWAEVADDERAVETALRTCKPRA